MESCNGSDSGLMQLPSYHLKLNRYFGISQFPQLRDDVMKRYCTTPFCFYESVIDNPCIELNAGLIYNLSY